MRVTTKTDYDDVSTNYDGRYARHDYPGIASTLTRFVGSEPRRVLELGSGTGHWLGLLRHRGHDATGIDPSRGMIKKALAKVPAGAVVLGRAESLPFPVAQFDRVFAINAVHHFGDLPRALQEARRVLRPGGELLIVGLDPSAGTTSWAVYDFFPGTEARDLERFPSVARLRELMEHAGFERCATTVAERIQHERQARVALVNGALHKHATSQLSELSDEAYGRGIAAIEAAASAAEARGEVLTLRSDLQIYATLGVIGR
jgi:SAM-dependent methyltransferase